MKKKINLTKILPLIIIIFSTNVLFGVEPEEILQNSNQELRARNISKNIRCLVCQNQSIDESNAPLAKDLRILIRNKIKDNYDDEEIYDFLTNRYGDFILLKPPIKINTLLLWFSPFIFLMIGFYIIWWNNKKFNKL